MIVVSILSLTFALPPGGDEFVFPNDPKPIIDVSCNVLTLKR